MNIKNCVEIVADKKYVRKIFRVRYELKIDNMTRPKIEDKDQAKIASKKRILSKI